jgi:hypothetical protein
VTCAHRKLIYRINGKGRYYASCPSCHFHGPDYPQLADAYLHVARDLKDADALKAAELAKGAQG